MAYQKNNKGSKRSKWNYTVDGNFFNAVFHKFGLIFFHLLARKPNLEKKFIFIQTNSSIIFTSTESGLRASGLTWRLLMFHMLVTQVKYTNKVQLIKSTDKRLSIV